MSWSREHVWPDSFGLDPDNVNPGGTGADAGPDFTDLFNLRPCLQTVNSQRSNLFYDTSTGALTIPPLAPQCSRDGDSWEPCEAEKGDLARTIFYMATRYDGTDPATLDLEIANTPSTVLARFANLATLLRWNDEHPPDAAERGRNQMIHANYQHNRNPFIDHPEYVNLIWGHVRIEKLIAAVTEGGVTDSYTIALGSQPTADVALTLAVTAASQIIVSPATLAFSSANWSQPQGVTISAVNDTVHEAVSTARVQHSVASADNRYAALVPLDVSVTVNDDDPLLTPSELPLNYGGPWSPLPSGFLGVGLGSPYGTSLGGDTSTGSAKFDDTGDLLTIGFDAAPQTLGYRLKGNPPSGTATNGTFVVKQSADGVNFSSIRIITDKDNTDQAFSDTLAPSTRYVSFAYSSKVSGNLQFDGVSISAAPGQTHQQNWRHVHFGSTANSGDGADTADPDTDGISNLLEYALDLNPTQNSAGQLPQGQMVGASFVISFTQPPGVTGITYGAEWSATMMPDDWHPITDSGTPLQHTFSVPIADNPQLFMRLKVTSP